MSLFGRARVVSDQSIASRGEETGWLVGIGVTVPLDRMAQGAIADPQEPVHPTPNGSPEPGPNAAPSVPAVAHSGSGTGGPSVRFSAALARETVQAVLRAQGDGSSRRRLDSLATRASSSAWLPELRLGGGHQADQLLRLNPTLDDPTRYTQSGGSGLWAEVRLTWRLDRLVFTPEELAVERLRGDRAAVRMRLVSRTFEVLVDWHRARLKAQDPSALPEERAAAELDRLEAELWLDVLSGGWFTRRTRPAGTDDRVPLPDT